MRTLTIICLFLVLPGFVSAADVSTKKGAGKKDAAAQSDITWGLIEIKGEYHEGPGLPGLFGDITENMAGAIARLDKAAADPKVGGLILKIDSPHVRWGKVAAFRQAIARVREKGKKVHAYLDGATNMDYLLATACDEIVMPESGTLMVVGLRAEVSFYKNLFEKLGIKAEMLRVGEFKSAAEPFTRTEMSPAFKKEMEEILDDYYRQLVETIAKARNLTPEKVSAAIDGGPQTAKQAKELGLIDRIAYEDELESAIKEQAEGKAVEFVKKYGKKKIDTDFSGFAGMVKFMELLTGEQPSQRKNNLPKIAVIYASGSINSGRSKSDMFGNETSMGSDTIIKAVREANKDKNVKALVLRVDSPGGSALASDLMWRELELVKKPFVVSMGDVAASGGYYISMGANRIFAEPGTLTGSIGVVGGKLALEGLYDKIGITTTILTRGKNSGVLSTTTGFTDGEREAMQKLLNDVYDQFVGKAAKGRKMEKDALEKLARGRVYTGAMALKIGLVDELGSLDDAVAHARKLAGLAPEDKVERLNLPKPVSPLESLFGPLDPNAEAKLGNVLPAQSILQSLSPDLQQNLKALNVLSILSREPVLMVLPFRLNVR